MTEEGDQNPLNNQLSRRNQIGKIGILRAKKRFSFFDDVAFQGGFAIDQSGDNVVLSWFAEFEDHRVTVADVGVDH